MVMVKLLFQEEEISVTAYDGERYSEGSWRQLDILRDLRGSQATAPVLAKLY